MPNHHPTPPSPFRIYATYAAGAISALTGLSCLIPAELYDRIDGAQLLLFGAPLILGLLSLYLTWLSQARIQIAEWMMLPVVVGYLGVPVQFLIGAVLVFAFLMTPQAGGWQNAFIFAGLALMVCSAGLLLASRQVHQELRARRRALMNA